MQSVSNEEESTSASDAPVKVEDTFEDRSERDDDNDSANDELERYDELDEDFESRQEETEPDYSQANKVKFFELVKRLETLYNQKTKPPGKRQTHDERLNYLLPIALLKYLKGGSPFPILRLIIPRIDTSRARNGMMEKTIANAWSQALGLSKTSKDHRKLVEFSDPTVAGPTAAGDLSMAIYEVVSSRVSSTPSQVTVGQVNDLLDELGKIKSGDTSQSHTHEWRNESSAKKKPPSKAKLRADWVEGLLKLNLSPMEHKWIVRILMEKVEIGLGYTSILRYYSPYAEELYSANNSLKRLCTTLSDPEWLQRRKQRAAEEQEEQAENSRRNYLQPSKVQVSLGNTLAPMLAQRTSFATALSDITDRHVKFRKTMASDAPGAGSMALKFPSFICEVKMDGDRILAHVKRGVVTMQTRRSTWYSNVYSPCLGPAIRRAIAKYDVDVIIDGEVISWDNERQETIPFGVNRSVANERRMWCERHNLIDARDTNLHQNQKDVNVMQIGKSRKTSSTSDSHEVEAGSCCWLKYVVFDVLYVGGPDAAKLLKEATGDDSITSGSIINLDVMRRRMILHRLIDAQKNEVELVPTLVIRSNGQAEKAADYFSPTNPSKVGDVLCSTLDSINSALDGSLPNRPELEAQLRGSKSDKEINKSRVAAMNQFYIDIVETRGLEGLVFKDLAAPYHLGDASRFLRYWHKLKPDYNNTAIASDIDAVVIGAYYATGLAKSGLLNSFLLGCVDEENPGTYMTFCKISGGGTTRPKLESMLEHTGFSAAKQDKEVSYGNWFKMKDHGKSMPDFISKRSWQPNMNGKGWKCAKKDYPDLWIDPEDSVVLTINAAEFTASDDFSAGLTVRFPQITKVRLEAADGGVKSADEVESWRTLYTLFQEMDEKRKQNVGGVDFEAPSASMTVMNFRFLTEEEQSSQSKAKRKNGRSAADSETPQVPTVDKVESAALDGLTFVILEGNYSLDRASLDAEQAKEEGWLEEAEAVSTRDDVVKFVLKHSGTCKLRVSGDTDFLVGGQMDDARVKTLTTSLQLASDPRNLDSTKRGKELEKLRQLGGILKWTFLFSSVRRWIDAAGSIKVEDNADGEGGGPAAAPKPELPRPKRFDYLVLGEMIASEPDVYGIQLSHEISMIDFKRSLEEVQRSKRKESATWIGLTKRAKKNGQATALPDYEHGPAPWQYAADEWLAPCDRWIVAGQLEKLWKYSSPKDPVSPPTVLYPDVFQDGFGLQSQRDARKEALARISSARWDDVTPRAQMGSLASTLPLARVMGAQVTPHLHDGVTHILCGLKGCETMQWKPDMFNAEAFDNPEQATRIHGRLLDLHQDTDRDVVVNFVSADWFRKQFAGIRE